MYKPVVIIGAPRSGTNMLRDILCSIDKVETWPCDEINYIWRHGNRNYPSDEFMPEMATLEVKKFINREFDKFARLSKAKIVIEKTCANSMRVGFVDEVLPDAKYIFIVRDGLDTVGSAVLRWKAELDIPYLLKKVRYVPLSDLPYYASKYISSHIYRLFSKEKRVSFWGPQMNNMGELLKNYSLIEVCGLQWLRCIDNSERDFSNIDPHRIIYVRYEDLVRDPLLEFGKIIDFIGIKVSNNEKESAVKGVTDKSIGKGRAMLASADSERVKRLIKKGLKKHGYEL